MCLAVPGRVEEIYSDQGTSMGRVNFGGVIKQVCLAYLPDIQVGDYTIVHVGFALSRIDEAAALKTLQTFSELGLLEEQLEELRESGLSARIPSLDPEFDQPLACVMLKAGDVPVYSRERVCLNPELDVSAYEIS